MSKSILPKKLYIIADSDEDISTGCLYEDKDDAEGQLSEGEILYEVSVASVKKFEVGGIREINN